MNILITGVAGFVGFHYCKKLLENTNHNVIGIDNLNSYYDTSLKQDRLSLLGSKRFNFVKGDICDKDFIDGLFKNQNIDIVVHLAAQAGVRYSIENPNTYIQTNIVGTFNIIDACVKCGVKHLVYASSSSVYGENSKVPYSTDDKVDKPVSLYAATKKSDELIAYCYAKLYNIPTTGLRFFTVYGPFGRPDMAYFSFTKKLINQQQIEVYNYGNCLRDFTYIDDIVEGIFKVTFCPPKQIKDENGLQTPPYKIYNIGCGHPVNLMEFIQILSEELVNSNVLKKDFDLSKCIKLVPMQKGDVVVTYADTKDLELDFNYKPSTNLRDGLRKFAQWYFDYYIKEEK